MRLANRTHIRATRILNRLRYPPRPAKGRVRERTKRMMQWRTGSGSDPVEEDMGVVLVACLGQVVRPEDEVGGVEEEGVLF